MSQAGKEQSNADRLSYLQKYMDSGAAGSSRDSAHPPSKKKGKSKQDSRVKIIDNDIFTVEPKSESEASDQEIPQIVGCSDLKDLNQEQLQQLIKKGEVILK